MKSLLLGATSMTVLALSLSACSTLYKLDVTAYSDPDLETGNTYVILSANPKIRMDSPEFAEYASQLERALAAKNYERAEGNDIQKADIAVYLHAGISDPKKRFHEVNNAITETAYDTTTTREAQTIGGSQSGGSQGQSTSQTRSIEPARPDLLVGYESRRFATTVYLKHLTIQAVDLQRYVRDISEVGRDKAVPREIWSVDVETTGTPGDLSEVVPVMIAAAQPYIGANTDDPVRIRMGESDGRIKTIRGK